MKPCVNMELKVMIAVRFWLLVVANESLIYWLRLPSVWIGSSLTEIYIVKSLIQWRLRTLTLLWCWLSKCACLHDVSAWTQFITLVLQDGDMHRKRSFYYCWVFEYEFRLCHDCIFLFIWPGRRPTWCWRNSCNSGTF